MEKIYKKIGRKYVEVEPNRFGDIDFFEFSFLVEACSGRRPIARSMFFQRVINKYYYKLTQQERDNLFDWLNRNHSFKYDLEKEEKSCLWFNARFDKNNQYLITTNFKDTEETFEAFKWGEEYCTAIDTYIQDKYIINIEKINE